MRFVFAISFFASLHLSLNQGASVLPHLLGFLGVVICIYLTTPAITACSNRKVSTAAALSSLVRVVSPTNALNASKNSFVFVNYVHDYADFA